MRACVILERCLEEHKKCEELMSINPRGQLPTFKDGDAVVNESSAVVFYLENQYPEKPLLPADAQGKATVRMLGSSSTQVRTVRLGFPALSRGCLDGKHLPWLH